MELHVCCRDCGVAFVTSRGASWECGCGASRVRVKAGFVGIYGDCEVSVGGLPREAEDAQTTNGRGA